MKNQFFITVAFIAVTSFTSSLFAQQPVAKTADWDLAKNKGGISCSVVSTEEGCSITFQKIEMEMTTRDAASGLPTGKRQHQPFVVTYDVAANDNSVNEVKSPRDAASGLATGKRMHKPFVITKELDKSTPLLAGKSSSTDATMAQGSGKVSVQDFHFTMKGNGKTIAIKCPDGSCIIPTDCPDGQYTLSCDWSWGMSQSGAKTSPKRCVINFLLEIENGTCMAINTKGTGASNK